MLYLCRSCTFFTQAALVTVFFVGQFLGSSIQEEAKKHAANETTSSLQSRWRRSNLSTDENVHGSIGPLTHKYVKQALEQIPKQPDKMLPAFFPIVTGGKLVYRNYWGIVALDLNSGEVDWMSGPMDRSLDKMVSDSWMRRITIDWLVQFRDDGNHNILFDNSNTGTLTTDRLRAYAVDDFAVPPHPSSVKEANRVGRVGFSGFVLEQSQQNRLVAIDLSSGKLSWERGNPNHDGSDLANSYFMGPPYPHDGKLYVLVEKGLKTHLACLDADNGKPQWQDTIATIGESVNLQPGRRLHAARIITQDGLLICLPNTGLVVAYDPETRASRWIRRYRPEDPEPIYSLSAAGKQSALFTADGNVVFTAPDGEAVYCLNAKDGSVRWKATNDLYLAGVLKGKVLLVGKHHCRALELTSGKEVWRVLTGDPSGYGALKGDSYYLPLKSASTSSKPAVWALDMATGRILARYTLAGDKEPGNVVFVGDKLVSQTIEAVEVYEPK